MCSCSGEMTEILQLMCECWPNTALKERQCLFSKCIYILAGRLVLGTYSFYSVVNPSTYWQCGEYSLRYSMLVHLLPPPMYKSPFYIQQNPILSSFSSCRWKGSVIRCYPSLQEQPFLPYHTLPNQSNPMQRLDINIFLCGS